jgi:hypothetical protein
MKRVIEAKIANIYAVQLEKAKRELDLQTELREKKIEAYQKFLSHAYRCRNYVLEFSFGDRRVRVLTINKNEDELSHLIIPHTDVPSYAAQTKTRYQEFLESLKGLENVLYEYRIYLHLDAFVFLHRFKHAALDFSYLLQQTIERAKNIYYNTPDFWKLDENMQTLRYLAKEFDGAFRDLEVTMKKEIFTTEPVYWDRLPFSWSLAKGNSEQLPPKKIN